jgi:hypothetical protein
LNGDTTIGIDVPGASMAVRPADGGTTKRMAKASPGTVISKTRIDVKVPVRVSVPTVNQVAVPGFKRTVCGTGSSGRIGTMSPPLLSKILSGPRAEVGLPEVD